LILILEFLDSIGTSIFGTNQAAPAAQPTNVFGSNLPGTTVKFGPVSAQGKLSFFIFENIESVDHCYLYYQTPCMLKIIGI
jgi:hypothetical protein